jgi:hypothetical protein
MSSTKQLADNGYVPSSTQDLTAAGLMQIAVDAVKRQAATNLAKSGVWCFSERGTQHGYYRTKDIKFMDKLSSSAVSIGDLWGSNTRLQDVAPSRSLNIDWQQSRSMRGCDRLGLSARPYPRCESNGE